MTNTTDDAFASAWQPPSSASSRPPARGPFESPFTPSGHGDRGPRYDFFQDFSEVGNLDFFSSLKLLRFDFVVGLYFLLYFSWPLLFFLYLFLRFMYLSLRFVSVDFLTSFSMHLSYVFVLNYIRTRLTELSWINLIRQRHRHSAVSILLITTSAMPSQARSGTPAFSRCLRQPRR